MCKNVRKIFAANQTIRHIPLFSSNTLNPIDCINIEYFGIHEVDTSLIHVPQDNGRFRCCLQVQGENVPGYSSCGPGLSSITFVLPLIEYDCEQNNSSLLTERLEIKLALSGSILYYLNETTGVRHKSYVAILDRLYANVRDRGDSPLLTTFLDQSGALRDYGDANLAQLPLLPGLTPEDRRDRIMQLRSGFQGRPRSPDSDTFQTQFNNRRGYRANANQNQAQRMHPPDVLRRSGSAIAEHERARMERDRNADNPVTGAGSGLGNLEESDETINDNDDDDRGPGHDGAGEGIEQAVHQQPQVPLPPPVPHDDHRHGIHEGDREQGQVGVQQEGAGGDYDSAHSVVGSASALLRMPSVPQPQSPVRQQPVIQSNRQQSINSRNTGNRQSINDAEHREGSARDEHREANPVSPGIRQPPPPYWSSGPPPPYSSLIRLPPPPFQAGDRSREGQISNQHYSGRSGPVSGVFVRGPIVSPGALPGEGSLVSPGVLEPGHQGGGLNQGARLGNVRGSLDGGREQDVLQGGSGRGRSGCPPGHQDAVPHPGQDPSRPAPTQSYEENVQEREAENERNGRSHILHQENNRGPQSHPPSDNISSGHDQVGPQRGMEPGGVAAGSRLSAGSVALPRNERSGPRAPQVLDGHHHGEREGYHGAGRGDSRTPANRGALEGDARGQRIQLANLVPLSPARGETGHHQQGEDGPGGGGDNRRRESGARREPEAEEGGAGGGDRRAADQPSDLVPQTRGHGGRSGRGPGGADGAQNHGSNQAGADSESSSSAASKLINSVVGEVKKKDKKKKKKNDKQTTKDNAQRRVSPEIEKPRQDNNAAAVAAVIEEIDLTDPHQDHQSVPEEIVLQGPSPGGAARVSSAEASSSSPTSPGGADSLTNVLSQHSGDRDQIQRELGVSTEIRATVTNMHQRMSASYAVVNTIISRQVRGEVTAETALVQLEDIVGQLERMEEDMGAVTLGTHITMSLYASLLEIRKLLRSAATLFHRRIMSNAQAVAAAAAQRQERERLEEMTRLNEEHHAVLIEESRQRHQQRLAEARAPGRQHLFTPAGGLLGPTGLTPANADWSYAAVGGEHNSSRTLPLGEFSQHSDSDDVPFGGFDDSYGRNAVSSPVSVIQNHDLRSRHELSDSSLLQNDTSILPNHLITHQIESGVNRLSLGDEILQAETDILRTSPHETVTSTGTSGVASPPAPPVTVTATLTTLPQSQSAELVQISSTDSRAVESSIVDVGGLSDAQFGGQRWGMPPPPPPPPPGTRQPQPPGT